MKRKTRFVEFPILAARGSVPGPIVKDGRDGGPALLVVWGGGP